MKKSPKKFKAVEKLAKDTPVGDIKDMRWEGEEVQAESQTKITEDTGTGQAIILRFFEFGVNVEAFKARKPTAQELFNSHIKGMQSLLWGDGLAPFEGVEPRLQFSKDKKRYRFIIACIPSLGNVLTEKPKTLSQLLQ